MEKVVLSYILGDWVFSVMGKYHLNPLMLFDLAFQMKCKYMTMNTEAKY